MPAGAAAAEVAAGAAATAADVAAAAWAFAFPFAVPPFRAWRALLLAWASPKPQPPSRSFATAGAAHFPELKPQHADAQSASLVHAPVMNCVPGAFAADVAAGAAAAEATATAEVAAAAEATGAAAEPPVRAFAALALGWASPKPQPPSLCWATTGPAHFPLLKPQQADAQSASEVQAPVMNWVP